MYLSQLEYFRELAKENSYTKAAKSLYITQPSLSYAIGELEKEIGVPLFVKNGRRIDLTAYGETMLRHVERALGELNAGLRAIDAMRGVVNGSVRIAYIRSFGATVMPFIVKAFTRQLGEGKVNFQFIPGVNQDVVDSLASGAADIGFCGTPQKKMDCVFVCSQELVAVLPLNHPLASCATLSLQQLRDEPFIFLNQRCDLRKRLDALFKDAGIQPHIAYEVEDCNSLLAFVMNGLGVGIVHKELLGHSNYAVVPLRGEKPTRDIYMVWRGGENPAAEAFRTFVANFVAERDLTEIFGSGAFEALND